MVVDIGISVSVAVSVGVSVIIKVEMGAKLRGGIGVSEKVLRYFFIILIFRYIENKIITIASNWIIAKQKGCIT